MVSAACPVWLQPNIQLDPINSLGRETPATVVLGNDTVFSSINFKISTYFSGVLPGKQTLRAVPFRGRIFICP
jgi:hypothetical protein